METSIEQHLIDFNQVSLIHFTASAWKASIKISPEILRRIGKPEWVTGTKKLLSKEIIGPPIAIISSARFYIRQYCVPFPITGMNLVPQNLISTLDNILTDLKRDFTEAVRTLEINYLRGIELAKSKLEPDGLYNPSDYPHDIASKYSFEWRYFGLNLPAVLESMNSEVVRRERYKFIAMIEESREMTKQALMSQLKDLIEHAVERLTPDESGAPKRFHDTLITNFEEFFKTFYDRNLWKDDQMNSLVEEAKRILRNVSPDRLRSNAGIRETINSELSRLHQIIAESVSSLPRRSLVLDKDAA